MNTKLATTQIRLTQWASIIKDCKASGLKVDEYCQQHGLSRDAYYYWLRKVKETTLQQAGFVELPAPETKSVPATDFATQLIIKTNDMEIGINHDTPSELIARILEVIRHVE
jgi:transposase-like protein